jgi:hypothetical protein
MLNNLHLTIDTWLKGLKHYTPKQLLAKPSPAGWSVGQLYMHLLGETNFYMQQIKICMAVNENTEQRMAPQATLMFLNNEFPNEIIEGPPTNANTPQPESKDQLISDLMNLKNEIAALQILISHQPTCGRTRHPGLDYLNATEWFQFADMHFRHHLRQKQRLDDFLRNNRVQDW